MVGSFDVGHPSGRLTNTACAKGDCDHNSTHHLVPLERCAQSVETKRDISGPRDAAGMVQAVNQSVHTVRIRPPGGAEDCVESCPTRQEEAPREAN